MNIYSFIYLTLQIPVNKECHVKNTKSFYEVAMPCFLSIEPGAETGRIGRFEIDSIAKRSVQAVPEGPSLPCAFPHISC